MLDRERKVIIAFCENNMSSRKASEITHYCKSYTNKILKHIKDTTGLDPRVYKDLKMLESIARKGLPMDANKEFQEYLKRYADVYCDGNIVEARKHAIVRQVEMYYNEKNGK